MGFISNPRTSIWNCSKSYSMCKYTCLLVSPPQLISSWSSSSVPMWFPFHDSCSLLSSPLPPSAHQENADRRLYCVFDFLSLALVSAFVSLFLFSLPWTATFISVVHCLTIYVQVTLTYSLTLASLSLATHHLWNYILDTRFSIKILNLYSFKSYKMKTKWWN